MFLKTFLVAIFLFECSIGISLQVKTNNEKCIIGNAMNVQNSYQVTNFLVQIETSLCKKLKIQLQRNFEETQYVSLSN